jgi:signal transduction histidine kinase
MLRFLRSQLISKFQVIEAVDGNQAFDKASQFLPDIILLDMMMPGKGRLAGLPRTARTHFYQTYSYRSAHGPRGRRNKIAIVGRWRERLPGEAFSTTELHVRVKNLVDSHDYQRQVTKQNQVLEATLEQLKETETQLVQTEKLASLGRMSAGIIHEINNPLNFAKTATHMLKRQGEQPARRGAGGIQRHYPRLGRRHRPRSRYRFGPALFHPSEH